MKNLIINIPGSTDIDAKEATVILAVRLYELEKLSLWQAAEMAGLTKRSFAVLLSSYNDSKFRYSASELSKEVKNKSKFRLITFNK